MTKCKVQRHKGALKIQRLIPDMDTNIVNSTEDHARSGTIRF